MDKEPSLKDLSLEHVEQAKRSLLVRLADFRDWLLCCIAAFLNAFLPDTATFTGFPRVVLALGLLCAVAAVPLGYIGWNHMLWILPGLILPTMVLGYIWRQRWLALIGMVLAGLSIPECFGFIIYFKREERAANIATRNEATRPVHQRGAELEAQKLAEVEAARKKTEEEQRRLAAAEAARVAEAERINAELRRREQQEEEARRTKLEIERRRVAAEAQARLNAERRRIEEEQARLAREDKKRAQIEAAELVYNEKRESAETCSDALMKAENIVKAARENAQKYKVLLDHYDNGGAASATEIERTRKLYDDWSKDLEKALTAVPALKTAADKAGKEKEAAAKTLDELRD